MSRSFKIIIAVIFLSIGAVAVSSKIQAKFTENSLVNVSSNYTNRKNAPAQTLYLNNCARCHGASGSADTELGKLYDAPDLNSRKVKKMSRTKAARIIQNGSGSMPAFKKKLSAKEISSLVSYIKTL
ncbi:MAG: cytochrome c [Pyrinomonadaceae bacterium]